MKTRLIKKMLIITILVLALMLLILPLSFATSDDIDTNSFKTDLQYSDADYIFNKGAVILNIFRNIAAIVSVVVLTIIGVRYIVGSVEQKAEYKQTMFPIVVGCILVAGISGILTAIQAIF